ncbi:hypothetical protein BDF21DRAFT_425669 [Thamnidium elegans]|nr:hypothetical protein BDF21DRAFT_425669 [Thamnidium elegans]
MILNLTYFFFIHHTRVSAFFLRRQCWIYYDTCGVLYNNNILFVCERLIFIL